MGLCISNTSNNVRYDVNMPFNILNNVQQDDPLFYYNNIVCVFPEELFDNMLLAKHIVNHGFYKSNEFDEFIHGIVVHGVDEVILTMYIDILLYKRMYRVCVGDNVIGGVYKSSE